VYSLARGEITIQLLRHSSHAPYNLLPMSDFSFRAILQKLTCRQDLTRAESEAAFEFLMSGTAEEAQIGGFLVGLASKGPTPDEIAGAATVMRAKSVTIPTHHSALSTQNSVILDTCGTGGDIKGTFNISTAAAIVTAAAGVCVVKHGNRSASSRTGSADVLEALGVQLELPPEKLSLCLEKANLCFAYARAHHPAMKYVGSARKALGIPTIFNYIGPLTNPAHAKHQLLGVFAAHLTETLATVLRDLGSTRAWVVHAEDGLDELSTMSPTRVTELHGGQIETWLLHPATLDIPCAKLEDLQVADASESASVLKRSFAGENFPPRDITVLHAAAALLIAGKADDLRMGLQLATAAIDSGNARKKLEDLIRCTNE
jgi:anthranilate phosphoribosyltransferase